MDGMSQTLLHVGMVDGAAATAAPASTASQVQGPVMWGREPVPAAIVGQ